MRILIILSVLFGISSSYAQIGIGTIVVDNSAILDTPSNSLGILLPKVTTLEQNTIPLPAHSLLVYNTDTDTYNFNRGTTSVPNWVSINTNSTITSYLGQSAKYSNTDVTTLINVTTPFNIPVFGQEDWNDNSSLYVLIGDYLQISETGRYEITANISIASGSNSARKAPEIYILVNGIREGSYASTGYMRRTSEHEEASLHCSEVLELNAGDSISIAVAATANTGAVTMRSAGSSDFYIEKKN